MSPRRPLEVSGASVWAPWAPGGLPPNRAIAIWAVLGPFLVAPGGSRDPRGGLWDPPGRLLDVSEGVFMSQNGVPRKVTKKD